MNQGISHRTWAILGIGVATIAGLGLLLAFLGRGPGEPAPMITSAIATPSGDMTTSATPTPSDDPVVASVAGRPIRYSLWLEAVLLDQVMSELAGQPVPAPDETLQRLINEELVLQAIPPEQKPTANQIEARIAALEQTWGVDNAAVVTALEEVGLTRTAFERAVGRLLTVQAGLEILQSQGHDTKAWLEKQHYSAEIQIFESVATPAFSGAQSPVATPFASPLPAPATETPSPTPAPTIPEVAPNFTLERAGGGTLTLTGQLAEGPVVLVFFRRGG